MIRSVDARIVCVVEFRRIETEQHIDLVARPVLGLINLVILNESSWKVMDRWEARVFIDDWRVEGGPWVLVEPATDHLAVFRPFVIGVEGGMNPHKALA